MCEPLEISGFVLAGGRSSRMGRDKALLELGSKPLVVHAVEKLWRLCRQVAVLGSEQRMSQYGRLVPDLHPGCGPMGGLQAALADAATEWSLVLPVDLPFIPTMMLYTWARTTLTQGLRSGTRVALFRVDGRPQPTLLMIHHEMGVYLAESLAQGRYKLYPALRAGAQDVAQRWGLHEDQVLQEWAWSSDSGLVGEAGEPRGRLWTEMTAAQEHGRKFYFANLNTPEEFAEAQAHFDGLDT